jgi:ubiquinone/menaquinone biosynthesis C-methylase UbiE
LNAQRPKRPAGAGPEQLSAAAQEHGRNWVETPYFDLAERDMEFYWNELVFPLIADCDFSVVLDLAAGHGRNTEKLRHLAGKVYVVDVNEENVEVCRRRFEGDERLVFLTCDGTSLAGVPDGEVTLVYSFDSMVHFDSDVVRAYLREFRRVLRPGGRGMCHHSNFATNPSSPDFRTNPHWRNFMSRELFEHYCYKEGLNVLEAKLVDWGLPALDCITLFERPADG